MDDFDLDTLLKQHFRTPPGDRLNQLEQDVWRRIHARQIKTHSSWLEQLLAPILVPQYRLVTMAVAVALGLSAGEFSKAQFLVVPPTSTAQLLNLDVFSADKGLLLADLAKERS